MYVSKVLLNNFIMQTEKETKREKGKQKEENINEI